MRFSKIFIPTTKETLKDATLPSHQFLLRAGFIAQNGSGLYDFLPLGKMVYNRIEKIIREEMNRSGALEVSFSFVTPANFWRESGRFEKYGKELLRFKDRKENDFVLSPTNEESAVNMVKNRITSYKNLPLHIYQINTKFRDEARPRFGLLRGREFVMKDGYSFHKDEECLNLEFEKMHQTYTKIFTRLGLNFRAVEADSGAIGGSGSKEFMVLANNGEDDIVVCDSCEYAANIEAARRKPSKFNGDEPESNMMSKFYTPDIKTIDELADFFKVDKFFTIKAVIKKAIFENKESKIVIFFIRGCDELQETKAINACGCLEFENLSDEEILKSNLVAGFCGPLKLPDGIEFFIDNELKNQKEMIIGANEKDYHIIGFSVSNFKNERFKDLISVKDGDVCPCCNGKLSITKGIEVGHIFKLGTRYSKSLNATFLDENGKSKPFIMGCYGIGVSRLMAVAIESKYDDKGCIWNKEIAPFSICIIISNIKDENQFNFSLNLYKKLGDLGIDVLLDDRNERFGVKMNDYELIGIPYAVIVGKNLVNNEIEFIARDGLIKEKISIDDIVDKIKTVLR
ncbi:proline--tRNA ligase [Campylobacter sp. FMV-PI01]|uniref:Proline--tRNA ligase n=1 Tax=Campylobacter portucalensis TaxID=2608384 RepID=A0A6L5WFU4_9BACT|nr:proline--tRNA ligase [Campylobacter portucalensis]MSN95978.1 proline--tRNA ligase [Campylobacter portucalensis]